MIYFNSIIHHFNYFRCFSRACAAMDTTGITNCRHSLAAILGTAGNVTDSVLRQQLQNLLWAVRHAQAAPGASFRIYHGHVIFHVNSMEGTAYCTITVAYAGKIAFVWPTKGNCRCLACIKTNIRMFPLYVPVIPRATQN
jgi:hypothetical protein